MLLLMNFYLYNFSSWNWFPYLDRILGSSSGLFLFTSYVCHVCLSGPRRCIYDLQHWEAYVKAF